MSDSQDVIDTLTYGDRQPNMWCRIGIHKWTRWKIVHSGRYSDTKSLYYDMQTDCKQCGLPKLKEVVQK
jgi:hypothetical protein